MNEYKNAQSVYCVIPLERVGEARFRDLPHGAQNKVASLASQTKEKEISGIFFNSGSFKVKKSSIRVNKQHFT